jgi:hypothetical protein
MKLILSRTQALVATAIVLGVLAIFPARTQTLPPGTINIGRWPDDVPCRVLKRYPDGTWEITVPYTLYYTLHRSTKFKGVGVTGYWERKCRGLTPHN